MTASALPPFIVMYAIRRGEPAWPRERTRGRLGGVRGHLVPRGGIRSSGRGGRPLPDVAKESDAETWAEFCLKCVIAHSTVTCALPSTANPAHARENVGAPTGTLPTPAMRRVVAHMETILGFHDLACMPWYPDKNYSGVMPRARRGPRGRHDRLE
ncbi:hypothetical protein [Methylobacterium oryzisoli]|uniref:hypothetical protein n=1 Tax=Methylobacterium oryzisoli TaxID=3385502 RepID=UPI003892317C